jgi:hypothetical protein
MAGMLAATLTATAGAGAATCPEGSFEVSGSVTDAVTGLPLDRVTSVGIMYTDGTGYDGAGTDPATSTFSECLPIGEYKIGFRADYYFAEYFDDAADVDSATVISVVDGPVSGIDAALQPWPSISGRVTDRRGAPLTAVSIGITDADTGVGIDGEGVDSNGEFLYYIHPNYFTYPVRLKVVFAADDHWAEWYDNSKRFSRATVITVERDSGPITGISAELRRCARPGIDICFPKKFNE